MNLLRKTIRQIIKEIYEPSEEEYEAGQRQDPEYKRIFGIQSPEEQIADRTVLQEYQAAIRSTPEGKAMIKAFMTGEGVATFHSIAYVSYASEMYAKRYRNKSKASGIFTQWIENYGSSGNDVISCVAHSGSPGSVELKNISGDNDLALFEGIGFIMKGYPVIVSRKDVASQTLGAIPDALVRHQTQSGVAKRAGEESKQHFMYSLNDLEKRKFAGEVLLDNWRINGAYMNLWTFSMWSPPEGMTMAEYVKASIKDARNLGLNMHIYVGDDYMGKNLPEGESDKIVDGYFAGVYG